MPSATARFRKIFRWDDIVIAALCALAIYLFVERPIHPTVTKAPSETDSAEPIAAFQPGTGPNLARGVDDFSGKAWQLEGALITAGSEVAPDGTKTAALLRETHAGNRHRIVTTLDGLAPGEAYTLSIFVKPGQRRALMLEMTDTPPAKYGVVRYDLAGEQIAYVGGDIGNAGIQSLPDGWFRLWAAMPYQSAKMAFSVSLLRTPDTIIYPGTKGDGALIWGVQFEPGEIPRDYSSGQQPPRK